MAKLRVAERSTAHPATTVPPRAHDRQADLRAQSPAVLRRSGPIGACLLIGAAIVLGPSPAVASETLTVRGSVWIDGQAADRAEITLRRYTTSLQRRRAELGQATLPEPRLAVHPRGGVFEFTLPSTPLGNWHLDITHPSGDFVPVRIDLVPLDGDLQLPPLELQRGEDVTVTVVAPDGKPLEGALVLFDAQSAPLDEGAQKIFPVRTRSPRQVRRTDARGRASARLPLGERAARAAHPGYLMDEQQSEATHFDLTLHRGVPVDLALQRADGSPAANAVVRMGQYSVPIDVADERGHVTLMAHDQAGVAYQVETDTFDDGRVRLGPGSFEAPRAPRRVAKLTPARRVRGRVVDGASETPLANALVFTAWRPGDAVLTDQRGRFELPILDFREQTWVMTHHVDFVRSNWRLNEQARSGRGDGDPVDAGDVALQSAQRVAVQTLQSDGSPLAGALVQMSARTTQATVRSTTVTDASGRARLFGLPRTGRATLRARAIGLATAELPVQLDATAHRTDPEAAIEITLSGGLLLTGLVVDEHEQPVAEATVLFHPAGAQRSYDGSWFREPGRRAEELAGAVRRVRLRDDTGPDGHFLIPDAPPGTYEISVLAPGFSPLGVPGVEIRLADAVRGPEGDLGAASVPRLEVGTLVLRPSVAIAGRVIDPDGAPVAGAELRFDPGDSFSGSYSRKPATHSDSEGRFRIEELQDGLTYSVEARAPGWAPARRFDVVAATSAAPIELQLAPGADLLVRVQDPDGEPSELAHISLHARAQPLRHRSPQNRNASLNPNIQSADGSVGTLGQALLTSLQPGPWALTVLHPEALEWSERIEIEAREPSDGPQEIDVQLERGRALLFDLRDPDGHRVNSERQPRIAKVRRDGNGYGALITTPLQDGRLSAVTEPDVAFSLLISVPGFRPHELEIEAGSEDLELRVDLDRGRALRGRVVDPEGAPAQALVRISGPDDALRSSGPSATASDGSFEITGLGEAVYRVSATGPEGRQAAAEVDLTTGPGDGVLLELQDGFVIRGRVVGLDANELSSLRILGFLMTPDLSSFRERSTTANFEGDFSLRLHTAGEWSVQAQFVDGSRRRREVRRYLGPESAEPLLFDFAERNPLTVRVLRNGQPFSGAWVRSPEASAVTDAEGVATLNDLPDGVVSLSVGRDAGSRESFEVTLPHAGELVLEIDLSTIRGRVVDATTGEGVTASITASMTESGQTRLAGNVYSNPDGSFELEAGGIGPYRLRFQAEGYEPLALDHDVNVGQSTDVELRPAGILRLRLANPTPEDQVARLVVTNGRRWKSAGLGRSGPSFDASSDFLLRGLAPGQWRGWLLAASGWAPFDAVVTQTAESLEPLRFTLRPYGEVLVKSASPRRRGDLVLVLPNEVGSPESDEARHRTELALASSGFGFTLQSSLPGASTEPTDVDHEVRVLRVPAGLWTLRLQAADGSVQETPVQVAPLATSVVELP